ncbi:MAG: cytochrome c family protein [Kofleriaceae bacterium]
MKRMVLSGLLACGLATGAVVVSCRAAAPPPYPEAVFAARSAVLRSPPTAGQSASAAGRAPQTFACSTNQTIVYGPTVPGDNTTMTDQRDADCFAWQEFVSLNWPVTGDGFGAPGDATPVQWQTFMSSYLLFSPTGATPPAWGTQPAVPPSCQTTPALPALRLPGAIRSLQMISKASGAFVPTEISEAAPFNKPSWLGAQNGTNVWYEVVVDQDEYNYVAQHQLYNAHSQAAFVAGGSGQPIVLPMGTRSNSVTGAIELKAAWMEITDPDNPKWAARYKLAASTVLDPETGHCRNIVVALVGLHIIHKTTSQTSWVWATFEHVDNAPDAGASAAPPPGGYNFYNPNCQPQTLQNVPTSCLTDGGTSPVTVGCTANVAPPYYLSPGCPKPVPVQVTRVTPIDASTSAVNQAMQANIQRTSPGSVWQYYQLVNAIWSTNAAPPPTAPQQASNVQLQGMQPQGVYPFPSKTAVASTVLETYAQTTTCIQCHVEATLAAVDGVESPWFADFSFLLGNAGAPATSTRLRKQPVK